MDWLAQVGAGALYVGIGAAVIIDLVILAIQPEGPYVSDVIRSACARHPFLIFAAGAACGHLFWTTVVQK